MILQSERFKKEIASRDKSDYKVVPRNKLVVAFPIDEGLVCSQTIVDAGIVSPAYTIYSIDESVMHPKVLERYLRSDRAIQYYISKLRGTTLRRRSIPKEDFYEMTLKIPSKEEQEEFLQFEQQVDKSKVIALKAAEKYDQLVKSRFIEMFGTPTKNEKQWPTEKMRDVAPATQSDNGSKPDGNWLLNLDAIQSNSGEILFKNRVPESELNGSIMSFSPDHVLYSKLRPYLNKVAVPDESGYGTTELIPLLPDKSKLSRTYLAYLLRSEAFVSKFSSAVAGTKMPRVSMDVFWKFNVPLPPMQLQIVFESFVQQVDKSKVIVLT